jgi:hypothetical protein
LSEDARQQEEAYLLLLQRRTDTPSLELTHEGVVAMERSDRPTCSIDDEPFRLH